MMEVSLLSKSLDGKRLYRFFTRTGAKKSVIYEHRFLVAVWEMSESCKR